MESPPTNQYILVVICDWSETRRAWEFLEDKFCSGLSIDVSNWLVGRTREKQEWNTKEI